MVGDLLHGPDLHRQVKPVDNMRRRFGQRLWQSLHDFGAIRKNSDLSVPGISLEPESSQRPCPHFKLRGVARHEIMTRRHPSSAAATTRDDDFKIARGLLIRASDMSGIDADDEFAQGIIRHSEFELCALAFQWRILPLLPKRLVFQAGAKRQGPLAHRLMALGRFNGQEFGQELRGLAVRQHAAQAMLRRREMFVPLNHRPSLQNEEPLIW